jgi:2-hydroxy-3-oxopropionate reductase
MMERVGFVGLGIMGAPMAANLLAAGFPLVVHNRSRGAVDALVADGAQAADGPAALAGEVDIVVTMLPDSPDVEAVVLGEGGVAEGIREGALLVDMSTIAPAVSRRIHETLAARGVQAVDAPVSGGEPAARDGQLAIMAGGEEAAVRRARPLFDALGKATTHIGPPGAGQVAKAANQVMVALHIQAAAEALLLATRAGVDPARVREALLGGFAASRVLEVHGQRMLDGSFEPGFRAALHRKDLGIAQQTGREEGAPLPATSLAATLFDALIAQGDGDRDHAALTLVYERLAGEAPG